MKGKDGGDSDSLGALLPEVQPPRQDRHSDKLENEFNFALRLVQIIQATL